MKVQFLAALAALMIGTSAAHAQGHNVNVPNSCAPAVNAKLQQMIRDNPRRYTENVMACGISQGTYVNSGGRHGSHHIITVQVQLPQDGTTTIQIAVNDSLDGAVSANRGDTVFAYGQGYITHGRWKAGIHDVHCSTHATADNGWIVVNGKKTPAFCSR